MAHESETEEIRRKVRSMMPGILEDLKDLITYPSVAFPDYPPQPVLDMANATVATLRRYGLQDARLLEITPGYPAVYGEIPAPPGSPTVMMYAHYDVQPARKEDGWETDPWTPVVRNGRLYGRGAADDKSGIMIAAASLGVFAGRPPVGVKVIIEGGEEAPDHIEDYVAAHPELFSCDVFIIADNGNLMAGNPALTTTLRGEVSCILEVKTLDHAVHSGSFGGAAPDALVSLIRMLATLHDSHGDAGIEGLHSYPSPAIQYPEELYKRDAGLLEGVGLIGTGPLSARLWSKPSITVIGIDAPPVTGASNILIPHAAARISMRISPDADPSHELLLLMDHLRSVAPWNVHVNVSEVTRNAGFVCPTVGPGYMSARVSMESAFGKAVEEIGAGGSIPLLHALKAAVLAAEFILWGAQDASSSRIHGTDESVDLDELERFIVAQSLFLQVLGKGK